MISFDNLYYIMFAVNFLFNLINIIVFFKTKGKSFTKTVSDAGQTVKKVSSELGINSVEDFLETLNKFKEVFK